MGGAPPPTWELTPSRTQVNWNQRMMERPAALEMETGLADMMSGLAAAGVEPQLRMAVV